MLTLQEIYDKVRAHLLTQNAKSIGPGGCRYYGPNGLKCAVGCLVPPDKYSEGIEDQSVFDIRDHLQDDIPKEDLNLDYMLQDLQSCHDNHYPVLWPSVLDEIAHKYGLHV